MLPTVVARSTDRSVDRPCHLQSLPRRALAIAPLRLALAVAGLVAAVAAGSARASALLAFGATTVGTLFFVIADPMAGILAGLGLAALAGSFELRALERRYGLRLFVERDTSEVLCRAHDHGRAHGGAA